MDMLLGVIGPIFWGLVLLSALVFVHEGGHFLAARACGVRVLEFFLGMPCRYSIHHVSKRIGTKFGVTPILLGGYAEICGMDPTEVDCAPRVLAAIHRHGVTRIDELADELDLGVEQVEDACVLLCGWGSILPWDDGHPGDTRATGESDGVAPAFAAAPRDAKGNTIYDGRSFERGDATCAGEPWMPPMGDTEFFEAERSHTYIGKGFFKRAFMLIAGIAVNILTGFLLVIAVYSVLGVSAPLDANMVGGVVEGSPAQEAGLQRGDMILGIDRAQVDSWSDVLSALGDASPSSTVSLEIWRPAHPDDALRHARDAKLGQTRPSDQGERLFIEATLDSDGLLGINVPTQMVRLDPLQSCKIAIGTIAQTADSVVNLLNPHRTIEVLGNSTSIVGISVMSAEAAAAGPATFLNLAALISFSLGFMNLIPIAPLDGGKLLIEAIQAATRRTVPVKVQTVISMIGIALFALLFIYMLGADITRFL